MIPFGAAHTPHNPNPNPPYVSQSVEPHHPHALEFLYRDCTNVVQFFRNMGVADLVSARELFLKVSQLDISAGEEYDFLTQGRRGGVRGGVGGWGEAWWGEGWWGEEWWGEGWWGEAWWGEGWCWGVGWGVVGWGVVGWGVVGWCVVGWGVVG